MDIGGGLFLHGLLSRPWGIAQIRRRKYNEQNKRVRTANTMTLQK